MMMPAHRKASQGSSGCVPFTNTSYSNPRGMCSLKVLGPNNQYG